MGRPFPGGPGPPDSERRAEPPPGRAGFAAEPAR